MPKLIDPVRFERHFIAFKTFVEAQSDSPFVSFLSNPYIEKEEHYKYDIYNTARDALQVDGWREKDVGSGKIAAKTIKAIEFKRNNVVPWQAQYGPERRPHHALHVAVEDGSNPHDIERILFRLYRTEHDDDSFSDLIDFFGKSYPLIAYLMFIKDRSRYLPIAPTTFDNFFNKMGVNFATTQKCSWENYSTYLDLIAQLKAMLTEVLETEVTLLDAHSFAWILSKQMVKAGAKPNFADYDDLSASEREAIVKARIGQGRFRNDLLAYWSSCAVTGCKQAGLLKASHIKPWAQASLMERTYMYNGLFLSPNLDTAFDSGYISFNADGKILLSPQLTDEDAQALSIGEGMRLRKMETEHGGFLAYHREHIFRSKQPSSRNVQ